MDFRSPYVLGLLAILAFALLTVGLIVGNMFVQNDVDALKAEIDTIKASSAFAEADKLRTNINTMQQYDKNAQAALEKFAAAKILGTSFLEEIAGVVPAGANLSTLTTNRSVVQIACTVPSRKAAAELQLHLKELPLFESVHMSSLKAQGDTGFIATIECIIGKAGELQ